MQENSTFLNLNRIFPALNVTLFVHFLRDNLDFDPIDSTDQFCLKNWFTLLLSALDPCSFDTAINTSSNGHTVDFECLVAVDHNKEAVETVRQGDRDFRCNLEV